MADCLSGEAVTLSLKNGQLYADFTEIRARCLLSDN